MHITNLVSGLKHAPALILGVANAPALLYLQLSQDAQKESSKTYP